MKTLLRVLGFLLILTFVLLAYLGINNYLSKEYSAIPFGLVFVTLVLDILVSRRNMVSVRGSITLAGTPEWKFILIVMLLVGGFASFMGVHLTLKMPSEAAQNIFILIAILAALLASLAILRVAAPETKKVAVINPAESGASRFSVGGNQKNKVYVALRSMFIFVVLGFSIPWAIVITASGVVPWIEISGSADGYRSAKFVVEKAYYNPGRSASWSVLGQIDGTVKAEISSSGQFNIGGTLKDAYDLDARFPSGKVLDVLFNKSISSRELEILNIRDNLSVEAELKVRKYMLIAYAPVVIVIFIVVIFVRIRRRAKGIRR